MAKGSSLPFKVGQLIEARSFEKGYLGAWFRCKIKKIRRRKGHIEHLLEYVDYEDSELEWVKLYEVPVHYKGEESVLTIRPSYPPVDHGNEMYHVNDVSEVTVIMNHPWKVGDLVDGLDTGCYWSGRITELLGEGKVKVKSPPPPMGEDLTYEFSLKDLRPSLDWSPEYGWTVLTPGHDDCPCARLVKSGDWGQETEAGNVKAASSANMSSLSPSSIKSIAASDELKGDDELHENFLRNTGPKEVMDSEETNIVLHVEDSSTRKRHSSDTNSSSHIRPSLAESKTEVAEAEVHLLKRYRASEGVTLNSTCFHTLEATMLDLEELVIKVKWIKSILEHGIPLSDAVGPQWKVM